MIMRWYLINDITMIVFAVFGVDLTTVVMAYDSKRPAVVDACIIEIEKRGKQKLGILTILCKMHCIDRPRIFALKKFKMSSFELSCVDAETILPLLKKCCLQLYWIMLISVIDSVDHRCKTRRNLQIVRIRRWCRASENHHWQRFRFNYIYYYHYYHYDNSQLY